ncbi:MAG TPA: helix-turn-helix domain-containing protein [Firmicutes bacterium]|nr:helix-turn-helix domain-containing protein [Bacillota bacterium]
MDKPFQPADLAGTLAALRRSRGATQEEMARALGVTNQAVSKWEAGACFPDTALLPRIADYFGVSLDRLFGREEDPPEGSFREAAARLRRLFKGRGREGAFFLAVRLSRILHEEVLASAGLRRWEPADADAPEGLPPWGYSACAEPEGAAILKGESAFFSCRRGEKPLLPAEQREIHALLAPLADPSVLAALFRLYELTAADPSRFVPAQAVAGRCGLPLPEAERALRQLPVRLAGGEGAARYRLDGPYEALPPLLRLLAVR